MKYALPILIFAALTAAACGSNSTPAPPTPSSPGPDVTINITGINGTQSFAPSPTTVNLGQRVI